MRVLMIDPPEGWRYGFPKELGPAPYTRDKWPGHEWFLANGYPKKLIDEGMLSYCRIFEQDV